MKRILAIAVLSIAAAMPRPAAADSWVRFDRPWTNEEVERAIEFCRMQPRLGPDITLFVDQLMGKQIQRCMYALGWVGVARQ
jgi:hypothetical protein